jgi:hypothetical protein
MELDYLLQAQRQLSEKDLIIYNAELQKKTKSVGLAYCLLIFFGGLGLHKFYLGKIGEGIAYLVFGTIDIISLQVIIFNSDRYWEPSGIVYILFVGLAIFLSYDLFTLSEQVSHQEKTLRIELLKQFGIAVKNEDNKVFSVFELIWKAFELIFELIWKAFELICKVFSENIKKIALCFLTLVIFSIVAKIVTNLQEEQARQEAIQAEQAIQKAAEQAQQRKIKILSEIVDNKDGTVTFKVTGLTWQKCSVGQTLTGETCSGDAKEMTWDEAMKVSVNFAKHNDWRLPTEEELMTLVFCSDSKYYGTDGSCSNPSTITQPTINTMYFPNTQSRLYWSSSPSASYSSNAWGVSFVDGNSSSYSKNYFNFVRLVR